MEIKSYFKIFSSTIALVDVRHATVTVVHRSHRHRFTVTGVNRCTGITGQLVHRPPVHRSISLAGATVHWPPIHRSHRHHRSTGPPVHRFTGSLIHLCHLATTQVVVKILHIHTFEIFFWFYIEKIKLLLI